MGILLHLGWVCRAYAYRPYSSRLLGIQDLEIYFHLQLDVHLVWVPQRLSQYHKVLICMHVDQNLFCFPFVPVDVLVWGK